MPCCSFRRRLLPVSCAVSKATDGANGKSSPGTSAQTAARKVTAPAKRKQAKPGLTSDKFRALVNNLSAQELDELLRAANKRKNDEIASARASFLDEVKARAATLGMSLADLVGLGRKEGRNPASDGRAPAAAKYRNPNTARPGLAAAVGEMAYRARGEGP